MLSDMLFNQQDDLCESAPDRHVVRESGESEVTGPLVALILNFLDLRDQLQWRIGFENARLHIVSSAH